MTNVGAPMPTLFSGRRPPSRPRSFLRSFTWGNVLARACWCARAECAGPCDLDFGQPGVRNSTEVELGYLGWSR
jgi:hypothetical protein